MTANQLSYQNLLETRRSNVVRETETNRANKAQEAIGWKNAATNAQNAATNAFKADIEADKAYGVDRGDGVFTPGSISNEALKATNDQRRTVSQEQKVKNDYEVAKRKNEIENSKKNAQWTKTFIDIIPF